MRKAWRVDLKWIFGIIFTIGCFLALNGYFLKGLSTTPTSKDNTGKPNSIESQGGNFGIPGFANNPVNKVFDQAKNNPDKNIEIPAIGEIELKGKDINGLSTEEAMKKIEKAIEKKSKNMSDEELQNVFKDFPVEGDVKKLGQNPEEAIKLFGSDGKNPFANFNPLSFFDPMMIFRNPVVKGIAGTLFVLGIVLSILSIIGLIFASYRSGKLVSPGVGLLIAAFPGTIGYAIGKGLTSAAKAAEASSKQKQAFDFGKTIITIVSKIIDKGVIFPIAFGVGTLLVFLGLILSLILLAVRRKPKTQKVQNVSTPVPSTPTVVPQETQGNDQAVEKPRTESTKPNPDIKKKAS